jgi:hypothetical protein
MSQRVQDAGRSTDQFEILMGIEDPSDRSGIDELAEAGVTGIMCAPYLLAEGSDKSFVSTIEAKLAALRQFSDEVIAPQG